MATISVSLPSDGSTADVSDYNTPITTIVNSHNGGIDNANIASGAAIATSKLADDAGITGAKLATNAVAAANLATNAITLGYTEITSDFTTTANATSTDVTSLTVTVTVPAGGRKVKITAWCGSAKTSAGASTTVGMYIVEGATTLKGAIFNTPAAGYNESLVAMWIGTPSAGSHTYKVQVYQGGAGTLTLQAAGPVQASNTPGPAFILVEAI